MSAVMTAAGLLVIAGSAPSFLAPGVAGMARARCHLIALVCWLYATGLYLLAGQDLGARVGAVLMVYAFVRMALTNTRVTCFTEEG